MGASVTSVFHIGLKMHPKVLKKILYLSILALLAPLSQLMNL